MYSVEYDVRSIHRSSVNKLVIKENIPKHTQNISLTVTLRETIAINGF